MRFRLIAVAAALAALVAFWPRGPVSDPEWHDVARLAEPRSHLQAVGLATGEILVAGGLDPASDDIVRATPVLLDPRTGASTPLEGRFVPRIDASLVVLPNDMVVIAGGSLRARSDWEQTAVTELFDPWTRRRASAQPMHQARADHGAAVLRDGRVIVAGGHRGTRMLDSVEIFDARRGTWTEAAHLPKPRQLFSMAALPDGRVLVAGGIEAPGLTSWTSLYYDPRTDTWSPGPGLVAARVLHTTIALPNGDVLLVGGQRAASGTAERYDFRQDAFIFAGTLVEPRMLAQGAALPDGRVLVAGGLPRPGSSQFAPTQSVELYEPRTNSWRALREVDEGSAFGGFVVTDRAAWLIGGAGADERALDRIVRFN